MAVKQYTIAVRDSSQSGKRLCGLAPVWAFFVKALNGSTPDYATAGTSPAISEVLLAAPAAPVPTTATTGGTVAAGTYPVAVTYVNPAGETAGSANGSVTTTGTTSTITVPSPAGSGTATGYYAYVGQAAGAAGSGTRQQALGSPTAIGTAFVLTAPPTSTGAALPATNTTGGGQYHFQYDAASNGECAGQIDCGGTVTNAADRYIDVYLAV